MTIVAIFFILLIIVATIGFSMSIYSDMKSSSKQAWNGAFVIAIIATVLVGVVAILQLLINNGNIEIVVGMIDMLNIISL